MPINDFLFNSEVEDKKRRFEQAIISDIKKQVEIIQNEINEYKIEEMKKAEDRFLEVIFYEMQEKILQIKQQAKQKITKAELDQNRELLLYRKELENEIFDTVRQKLVEFTKSENYKDYLLKGMKKALSEVDSEDITVYLRKDDLCFADDIKAVLGNNVLIQEDATILIGGFKILCQNKNIFIDADIETALENQRKHFYENSKLIVG